MKHIAPLSFLATALLLCLFTIGQTKLDKTKWVVTQLYQDRSAEQIRQKKVFIEFNTAENQAWGNCGCNQFNSTIERKGNRLRFNAAMTTKMACMGPNTEQKFLEALQNTTRYTVSGKTLTLFQNNTKVMILRKLNQ
jgi:heat shock protein HslJ